MGVSKTFVAVPVRDLLTVSLSFTLYHRGTGGDCPTLRFAPVHLQYLPDPLLASLLLSFRCVIPSTP